MSPLQAKDYNPMSVPSSVLSPGPNTWKETGKMNPKDEQEEGSGRAGEKQSSPNSPRVGPSARLVTPGPREGRRVKLDVRLKLHSGLYCPLCSKTCKSLKCYRRRPRCREGTENKSPSKHTWRKKMKRFHARIPLSSDSPVNWLHGERN